MKLSVVIPTRDRPEALGRVLDALDAQRGEVEGGVEVLVADDGSAASPSGAVRGRATILTLPPGGPARARNAGARAASGERLAFLGDDTVPEPGFLAVHAGGGPEAILGYTAWDRERMRVTPFLVHLNEKGLQFGYSIVPDTEDVPFNFFYTSNVSLPRAPFLELGGFDETFPAAAFEDVELAYRATRRSPPLRIVYRPAARTRHHHPTTLRTFRARQRRVGEAAAVLARKHPELAAWLGEGAARRAPRRRPIVSALCGLLVAALDPLGIPLPPAVYDRSVSWDYASGFRDGMSRDGDAAPEAASLHHTD